MAQIIIYNDLGVSQESLKHTQAMVKFSLPHLSVSCLTAEALATNHWQTEAKLFILPGGADIPYGRKLNRKVALLQDFVKQGGRFLGICAGAYYASSKVIFDEGGPLEVKAARPLRLMDTESVGPRKPYSYQNNSGCEAYCADLFTQEQAYLYYNGGGYFSHLPKGATALAYYEDKQLAALGGRYGEGVVVLSHLHYEYDPALLSNDPYHEAIRKVLLQSEPQRSRFSLAVMDFLGLSR